MSLALQLPSGVAEWASWKSTLKYRVARQQTTELKTAHHLQGVTIVEIARRKRGG